MAPDVRGDAGGVSEVLDHLEEYREELDTLMTEEFHVFHPQESPSAAPPALSDRYNRGPDTRVNPQTANLFLTEARACIAFPYPGCRTLMP